MSDPTIAEIKERTRPAEEEIRSILEELGMLTNSQVSVYGSFQKSGNSTASTASIKVEI